MATPARIHCHALSRGLSYVVMRAGPMSLPNQQQRSNNFRTTAPSNGNAKQFHSSANCAVVFGFLKKKKPEVDKQEASIVLKSASFAIPKEKSKDTFMDILDSFEENNPNRRGHVEFIYACLRNMEEFGVEKDLAVYKKLFGIFPKEKMVAKNEMQIEFMHFPWHQQCAIDILCKMEDFGVIPDRDVQMVLMEVFGYRSFPMRKFARMMYWLPKFKHASPFPLPNPVPNDTLELAILAIKRITGVDLQTKVDIYNAVDLTESVDHTWVVSAQSAKQKELIGKHPRDKPLHVDGAFRVWLRNKSIAYFILRAEPTGLRYAQPDESEINDVSNIEAWPFEESRVVEMPSVHEQEDGTIMATCATGTSSRDSLLSWVRFLQDSNPSLKTVPILFSLRAPSTAIIPVNTRGFTKEVTVDDVPND